MKKSPSTPKKKSISSPNNTEAFPSQVGHAFRAVFGRMKIGDKNSNPETQKIIQAQQPLHRCVQQENQFKRIKEYHKPKINTMNQCCCDIEIRKQQGPIKNEVGAYSSLSQCCCGIEKIRT